MKWIELWAKISVIGTVVAFAVTVVTILAIVVVGALEYRRRKRIADAALREAKKR